MEDFNAQGKQNNNGKNNGKQNRNNTNDMSAFVFGKVPPQAPDLEEAVLGALMIDKDALPAVMDIIRPESFYSDAHQAIYKAIQELFRNSKPIDLLTVTEEMRKMATIDLLPSGPYYLVEPTRPVSSTRDRKSVV